MMTAVTELRAWSVDPRDTSWEVSDPRFRVYFWRSLGESWASREFELSAADVVAVLAWAAAQAEDDETYSVHCVVENADGAGLVRLAGTDPTRTDLPLGRDASATIPECQSSRLSACIRFTQGSRAIWPS
jgi:hypothetical protein